MKLEKAYSLDLQKDITPTEADNQLQQGNIKSKFDFQCLDKNCDAQVTCANLDRAKQLRKREPYYKVVGEHSLDCLIAQGIEKHLVKKQQYDIYNSEEVTIDGAYRINLQPPSTKKTHSESIDSDGETTLSNQQFDNSPSDKPERKIQSTKTLSSIVDSFLNDKEIDIEMPDIGNISIQDLFIEINGQDISEFPDEWRIYYGKAWFNKRESGYSIVFANELVAGQVNKKPSLYISNVSLENSGFTKFNQQIMQTIANKNPKQVFLLSETAPYLKDGKYINIWCEAPHFMDYR